MAKEKVEKTNALRLLDRMKIPYEACTYPCEEFTDGLEVAQKLGLPPQDVCKTLVTVGKSGGHFVFVLPVTEELDREESGVPGGGEILGNAPCKRLAGHHRVYPGRMYSPGHEKAVSHRGGPKRPG